MSYVAHGVDGGDTTNLGIDFFNHTLPVPVKYLKRSEPPGTVRVIKKADPRLLAAYHAELEAIEKRKSGNVTRPPIHVHRQKQTSGQ